MMENVVNGMDKNRAVLAWIRGNLGLKRVPLFGFLQDSLYAACVEVVPGAACVVELLDGSRVCDFGFVLKLRAPFSQEDDGVNVDAYAMMEAWKKWLERQNSEGNYPDFGENCCCYEVRVTADVPSVEVDGDVAALSLPAVIAYLEGC